MVEEGDAECGASDGGEDAEGGYYGVRVCCGEAREGTAAGEEVLGGGESSGEEGVGLAEDLECCVCEGQCGR